MSQIEHDGSKGDIPFAADVDRARRYLYGRQRELQVHIIGPAQKIYSDATKSFPFTTAFITLFTIFSLLPLASFAAWTLTVCLTLFITSAIFIIFWVIVLCGGASLILLFSLAVAGFFAGLMTAMFISMVYAYKFWVNLRSSPTVNATKEKVLNGSM